MATAPGYLVRCRPAETGGVAGAVVLLLAHAFGLSDPDVIVALGVVVGFVPAVATWLRESVWPPKP